MQPCRVAGCVRGQIPIQFRFLESSEPTIVDGLTVESQRDRKNVQKSDDWRFFHSYVRNCLFPAQAETKVVRATLRLNVQYSPFSIMN